MPPTPKRLIKLSTSTPKRTPRIAPDDALRHLAFDNSLQPNIITIVSTGKIIMANLAASKLLGYSTIQLPKLSRSDIFEVQEKSFKKMLKQRTTEGQTTAVVTAIKKNGTRITCEITSAVFKDKKGVINAVTTIVDITKRLLQQKNIDAKKEKIITSDILAAKEKSDEELAANNEWIKYIAKTSYDVMWDWDIESGNIYVGDSVAEIFGYQVANNTIQLADFERCLLPADKIKVHKKLLRSFSSVAKSWRDAVVIKRKDGSLVATIIRASIVRDQQQKPTRLIGAMQDVSRLEALEQQLNQLKMQTEKTDIFKLAAKLSYDGIWDWHINSNEYFLGEGFETLFGYGFNNNHDIAYDWNNFLHPEDREAVEKSLDLALASNALSWEFPCRFMRADGTIAFVLNRASIIRAENGKAQRMIGVIHDLSVSRDMEARLAEEIELKEKQIDEAIADAKDAERSFIGKELHDNVNQLLGASRMFLEMAKRGGDNSEMYVARSSEYTMMAIEDIRKLTKGISNEWLNNLGLAAAIENMTTDIQKEGSLTIGSNIDQYMEKHLNGKFKLNIFRMIQELIKNIQKHAKAKTVQIDLSMDDAAVLLTIADDGVGFDNTTAKNGIGISNLRSRATSFAGIINYATKPGHGCKFSVSFPLSTLTGN